MKPIKAHYLYNSYETVCGIDTRTYKHRLILTNIIEDVACGRCKKIMLVFKSDSANRPRKNIAKRVYTKNNENHV